MGIKSGQFKPIDFGQIWHLISCPVLLLHGENSDLLLPETIAQMQETNPQLDVKHLANCGHAPALMSSEQIDLIKTWLG
jgi:pimeloyl-ACP methyl ester carboxylesterase